jgi:hypothetical protein
MDTPRASRITYVDRLNGGVVITFEDGRCGFFSTALLYKTLAQAEELTNLPNPDEEEA